MKARRRPSPPYNPWVRDVVQGKRRWSGSPTQNDVRQGFHGWHEGGYLPHRDERGLTQFVTFRLTDAFPSSLRSEWEALLKIEDDRQRRIKLEAYLDLGRGECHLRRPEIAKLVEDALVHFHSQRYDLRAWVVMPNHVHVLFRVEQVPMSELLDAWKGYTAKAANRLLGRRGRFWQDGYWDTYMRNADHERRTIRYIESNPTKAALTKLRKEWLWSSARRRNEFEMLDLSSRA